MKMYSESVAAIGNHFRWYGPLRCVPSSTAGTSGSENWSASFAQERQIVSMVQYGRSAAPSGSSGAKLPS